MNGPGGEGRGGGDSTPEGRGGAGELTGRLLGGRYRVTGQIGRGGMGVVCRAVDEVLGREVAVKVLRAYTDASAPELADLRTRMQREARAAARVRHPGVVTVHDVIDEDGRPVIVMELVDGPSLDDALDRGGPMDPCEIAAIGAKVMDALDAAHQVGVLHRDVKPGNVLLERRPRRAGRPDTGVGRVVLTDFGIASIEAPDDGASTHLTRSGELVGSLDYLPPERAQGQPPSPASDIWSLGMTLYAAVEGSGAPFRRTSVWSTLTAIVSEPLPEPRRAGPLTPVLHALMAKDPAARPSAAEARALLTAVADGRDTVRLGSGTGAGAGIGTDTGAGTEPGTGTGTGADPGMSWTPTAADVRAASAPSPSPSPSGGQAPTGPLGGQSPTGPVIGQAPTGPASAVTPGERETSTVAAAGTAPPPSGRGRRTCVLATAVAAVLVAGGGVTYGLMARDSGGTVAERRPGAPSQEQAARAGASGTPEETGVVEPGDKATGKGESGRSAAPATSGEPSKSAASGKPKPGGGGDPGNGKGGDGGAAPGGTGGGGDGGAGAGGGGSAASGGGSATGGTGGAPEPSSCAPIGGGKVNCLVWRTAASYTGSFQHAGTLNAGTNYFYCQANLGRRETYGRWTNTWWAKTDDDSGNSGVYVSAVYLKGGRNDAPVPGLPTC
ncbi:protein kinase domain-containing protein [Streptomyces chrestomyceticus]|uniref:serine/threonine-protein kinase n=1 Tax=Streptomyces chrestomyceticus TaxID=68185 RepID=UPI003F4CFE55